MIKLYLKTVATAIFLILFTLFIYKFGFSYLTKKNFNNLNNLVSQGTFSYIQEKLSKTPQSDWQPTLKKIQPRNMPNLEIISIKKLKLNPKNKSNILDGKIIFTPERATHFFYFLYYGRFKSFAIQRISNTSFALKMMLTQPVEKTIKDTTAWIVSIILHEMKSSSRKEWTSLLNKLEKTFDMPLKLISIKDSVITKKMRQEINIYKATYLEPQAHKPITTLYFQSPDPEKLLVIGPIRYSPLSNLFTLAQHYYFTSVIISSILCVLLLTWLFRRNVFKITQLTRQYSRGNFNINTTINQTSILHDVFQDITAMGSSLNRLIRSQENMARFVAHEVRTRLSTMQLALDSLKKQSDLSQASQEKVNSLQEDVKEIDKLIRYFLLYHKSTASEFNCKKEALNIADYLKSIIKRYTESNIELTFMPNNAQHVYLQGDPELLKHAIDNLISNALKFAASHVIISLEADKNDIRIHVDDDGPGIPLTEMKYIFEPFNTLNTKEEPGKHIGLGLTIAKSIITLHQGTILLSNSEKLSGARFSIILPRAKCKDE